MFADFSGHSEAWYPLVRSKRLDKGAVPLDALGKRLMAYRNAHGDVFVTERTCPHLGADLSSGTFHEESVTCPFHGWRVTFGSGPRCVASYPAQERWGFVWVYNGTTPAYELPRIPTRFFLLRTPAQHIACHPHLVIGNGLDVNHFDAVHGLIMTGEPRITETSRTLSVDFIARAVPGPLTPRGEIDATFKAYGGNMAVAHVRAPIEFFVVFTGLAENEGCRTQTFFFLPRSLAFVRAFQIMYLLLHDDVKILRNLEFSPNFTNADHVFERYYKMVRRIPVH